MYWHLKEALNKKKKVLWIAHRHLLLEQAADTFQNNAYSDSLYNISSFNYRIVSGKHDRPIHIRKTDDVLIASKDSLARNLDILKDWLYGEDELFLVVDEAHHAIAKSYRKIIEFVKKEIPNTKIMGLTATPFRTADNEQSLLGKLFTDGIAYKVDLKDLIKKGILSRPEFEESQTDVHLGGNLGLKDIKSIEQLDNIPSDIADMIAESKERNSLIVRKYLESADNYGQTLVFAINRMHAIALKALFEKNGVPTEVIVSGKKAEFIGIDISNEENQRSIERYRSGEVKVLINVNILTEGVDLPKTKTVFLTRPTVSSILMTQMIGRALRGERAGGTREAYVVSFIDDWQERIAWVNAETLIEGEGSYEDKSRSYARQNMRMVSIAKIEEFARLMDETVDTSLLESVQYIKRIPLGMYSFAYIDENKMERNHQVLVYDSTEKQYRDFVNDLEHLFYEYRIDDEVLGEDTLEHLLKISEDTYFDDYMMPSYDRKDIEAILKYYAQKSCEPTFIPFDEIDRKKLDLEEIAKHIYSEDMRRSEEKAYTDSLWEDEESVLRIYFSKKTYFLNQLETEMRKLQGDFEFVSNHSNVEGERRNLNELTLYEMGKAAPEKARELKDIVYESHKTEDSSYECRKCGYTSPLKAMFQIDHIEPISKGGLTEISNLQLLCKKCNMEKSDSYRGR